MPRSGTPNCSCHGEPCYWHKKKDMLAGGLWRCAVRKREVQRERDYAARKSSNHRYWHKPGGGYVRRRRRELADQRAEVLDRLDQLAQEATSAES